MILYSRNDCPLCEDVEQTLIRLNITYEFIDIDEDDALLKKYHVRIPVLVNQSKQQLFWPFSDEELLDFCNQ